ncbi:MAG TPA: hypothetical protein VEY69_14175 [Lautropia sp.]|nr:hypothetical protein [Lautropia sp.]
MLDETTFVTATRDPRAFQEACKPMGDPSHIMLQPSAVAILALNV